MITAIAAETLARVYYGLPLQRTSRGGMLTSFTVCVSSGFIDQHEYAVTPLGVAVLLEFIAKRRSGGSQ